MNLEENATRHSSFSYVCKGCGQCCYDKLIQVNPYEVLRISDYLGLSTTEILEKYVRPSEPYLRSNKDGSCIFLDGKHCGIHEGRPTVCRVYPLGLSKDDDGNDRFTTITPAPFSEGVYGHDSTIGDYLSGQIISKCLEFGSHCLQLQQRIYRAFERGEVIHTPPGFGDNPMDWLDVDKVLSYCDLDIAYVDIESKLKRYIEIISLWIHSSTMVQDK